MHKLYPLLGSEIKFQVLVCYAKAISGSSKCTITGVRLGQVSYYGIKYLCCVEFIQARVEFVNILLVIKFHLGD